MQNYDISIIIPARSEMFLARTIQDILEHKRGKTEIIAVLDGAWADPAIPDHPDVKILYYPEAIGQRATTNVGVRLSRAKYVIKCDAHCSFDEGFDLKMLEAFKVAGDNAIIVPVMRNLHAFDWVCKKCGDRRYQGPTPTSCPKCDNTKNFERDMKWIGKPSPQSTSYCFDSEPHFQYFKEYAKRPEYKKALTEIGLTETMSLQGSFFMIPRKKYWELNICDEAFGSWGSQGIETACKTWLSGGRVLVNHKTWYAHLFRTQGGDFGFPYPQSGKKVQDAKKYARNLFFNNRWDKQIYPLSWLVERFWPIRDWSENDLKIIQEKGKLFFSSHPSLVISPTDSITNPASSTISDNSKKMTSGAVSFSSVNSARTSSSERIDLGKNKLKMERVAASPIITNNMIQLRSSFTDSSGDRFNKKGVQQTMDSFSSPIIEDSSISITAKSVSRPNPATSISVDSDSGFDFSDNFMGKLVDNKEIGSSHNDKDKDNNSPTIVYANSSKKSIKPTKGIIFYTDNQLKLKLAHAVQNQLRTIGLPIVSTSLKPMVHFGKNIHVPLKRGVMTMFTQILTALKASDADIIFHCEHDVIYSPTHFEFTPPTKDKFYYNQNFWRIRLEDGFSAHWDANQVSGLCAYREHLIAYYEKRIKEVEEKGFNRSYEPGGRDAKLYETWMSPQPNIDIRHAGTLSGNKWSPDDFRDKSTCINWKEGYEIPGWGKTLDVIKKFRLE